MTTITNKPLKSPLATLEKGLQILEFVVQAERLVRLKDVADAFSMDRSTALRFLQTLQSTGYLQKYEELKAYSPGPKVSQLHQPKPTLETLINRIRPYLAKLAKTTGQSAHLGVLEGNNAILVGVASSPGRISVKQAIGDLEPLYVSAVGKAIYAHLPMEQRQQLAEAIRFKRHTATTIADFAALEREAEEIRKSGIAFDNMEGSEDVACIACPIFDEKGTIVFSIGISMVAGLLNGSLHDQHELIEQVKAISEEINSSDISG